MNESATNWNKSLCNKIDMQESFLEELKKEIQMFKENEHTGFTDYDHHTVDFSLMKIKEAEEHIHQASMNMKKLLFV